MGACPLAADEMNSPYVTLETRTLGERDCDIVQKSCLIKQAA